MHGAGVNDHEKFEKWRAENCPSGMLMRDVELLYEGYQARQPEIDAIKAENLGLADLFQKKVDSCAEMEVGMDQEIRELKASMEGCIGANEYNKTVIRRVSELNDALKAENERLRNAAKPVIDYWFEEDATGTQNDHNKAFLELSNAYYRRCNHAAMADKGG